jgi:hypothetical protein
MSIKDIPNNKIHRGNVASSGTTARQQGDVHPANAMIHDGNPRGSFPDQKMASPVVPPNHQFKVGTSNTDWPDPVVSPGHGAVPVNPWMGKDGFTVPAAMLPDSVLVKGGNTK